MGVELPTILLVAPFKSAELRVGQYLSPPLGIYRIASYLKKKGITVRVIDCNLEGEDKFSETIKETHFDIIGFSLLYSTLKNDIRLMYSAIELSPDSLLIAGGQGAVFSIDFLLKNTPLDIIVKGFGEYTLSNMLDNFFSEGSLKDRFGHINSIAFKDGKNIHHTELLENYTPDMFKGISMSFDFDFVPYEKYWEFMEEYYSAEHLSMMRNENMLKTIRLITSSSCLMGCSFCSSTNFLKTAISSPQKLHSLSADEILSLIRKAKQAHPGVTAFYFCDDDFLQRRKRVAELCDLLARDSEFRNITFFCLSRIDRVDSNLLEKLNKANFKFII
ncbi:cobalamin-dependent protein, partial [Candidatus Woesearchaeota archaeon]|nr:cobalamin-dependent protein [Candidatus Woesearchaeota archaeon]